MSFRSMAENSISSMDWFGLALINATKMSDN